MTGLVGVGGLLAVGFVAGMFGSADDTTPPAAADGDYAMAAAPATAAAPTYEDPRVAEARAVWDDVTKESHEYCLTLMDAERCRQMYYPANEEEREMNILRGQIAKADAHRSAAVGLAHARNQEVASEIRQQIESDVASQPQPYIPY